MAYIYIYPPLQATDKKMYPGQGSSHNTSHNCKGLQRILLCSFSHVRFYCVNHSDLPDVTSQCAAVWTVEALHMHITRVYIYVCAGKRLWVQNLTWLWMNVQVLGQKHTCMHVCMLTHTHACMHARTHARTHTHTHTYTHTHILTHTHTCTCTH